MIEMTAYEAIGVSLIAFATGVVLGAYLFYALVKRVAKMVEKKMEGGYGLE